MSNEKSKRIVTNNREMTAGTKESDNTEVFFFPKRNPPISVRATSIEEAAKILEESNTKEI